MPKMHHIQGLDIEPLDFEQISGEFERVVSDLNEFPLLFIQISVEAETHMDLKFKNISHKLIDSLSDGVYSIALTLLGLSVVELVPEISHSEGINTALREHWPTLFSYALGFVVLFSSWYQYHVISQYTKNTNAWIVWNHGLSLAWVALLPFGVAMLAQNLNTAERDWAVFYFGICLFGTVWTNWIFFACVKFKVPIEYTEDLPLTPEEMKRATTIFLSVAVVMGLVLVPISLAYPWVALAGYGVYVGSSVRPIASFNSMKKLL